MLLTVLAIGGAILGATSIAGLLMTYQIRATTDAAHSAQAVFAADAGTEWAQYVFFCQSFAVSPCANPSSTVPLPAFADRYTSVTVACYDANGDPAACEATTTAASVISKGKSLDSVRAFYIPDISSTSTTL